MAPLASPASGSNTSLLQRRNGGLEAGVVAAIGTVAEATVGELALGAGQALARLEKDANAAADGWGIRLEVVKLPDARKGFVLLPRRWVVERSFAWLSRFRRLAKDYERLETTVTGLHLVACST